MLFGELANCVGGWLWHNDMTSNRPELALGCIGRLVVEKAKGRMESIVGGGQSHGVVVFSLC
jgi:hypothetical protein